MNIFRKSDKGNTTIVFALSAVALMAATGAALDLNQMEAAKTSLNAAADAAILAAVKTADYDYTNGNSSWQSLGVTAGNAAFQKNLRDNMNDATIALDIKHAGNAFTGTGTYAWNYPTSFMGMFGIPSLTITRTVSAGEKVENYLDVHLLIDVSPSMGIGATDADQTLLHNATGCALACHYSFTGVVQSNYTASRASGAVLRLDLVRQATQQLINDMKARVLSTDQVRVSIDLYSNSIIPLLAPTTDLTAAATAAGNIDFATGVGGSGTETENALAQLGTAIGSSGTGNNPNNRKSYVVLISDGTENSIIATTPASGGWVSGSHDSNFTVNSPNFVFDGWETITTINHAKCDPIKAVGHTLLTGHVDYLIPTTANGGADSRFDFIKNTLISLSTSEFQACASDPSLAYTAKTPADITSMYNTILDAILPTSNIALTQ